MFNRNIDKETIKILLQENKRLKRENQRLDESLNELQRYKDEYRGLIARLDDVKEQYSEKMKGFDMLEKEWRSALGKIIGNGRHANRSKK